MSKVYEVLRRARAERLETRIPEPQATLQEAPFMRAPRLPGIDIQSLEREMLILDQSIADLTRHTKGTCLQFLGLHGGEGTSTIVREFAKLGSWQKRRSVLIVDAYRSQPQFKHFALTVLPSLEQSIHNDLDLNDAIHRITPTQLCVSSLYSSMNNRAESSSLATQECLFEKLRSRFNTVLLDTPPINSSIDGLSLCKHVDGVVLVIQAEKTKSVVIQHAKERIAQSGGTLLGIVFNKQRYYIPERVYRWL